MFGQVIGKNEASCEHRRFPCGYLAGPGISKLAALAQSGVLLVKAGGRVVGSTCTMFSLLGPDGTNNKLLQM